MRRFFYSVIIALSIAFSGFSTDQIHKLPISESQKAYKYLEEMGEVYFTFSTVNRAQIEQITKIISIDNVNGNKVLAYANKAEFKNFLNLNLEFKILQHPGEMLEEIKMWDPKSGRPYNYDEYPTFDGFKEIMNKFAKDYPDLCRIVEYGKSVKNRELLVAVISDNVKEREAEPQFFYCGTIHGDETTGYNALLRLMGFLLSNYGKDKRVSDLVDNMEIWIAPLVNPDGTYKSGNQSVSGAQRGNANGVDLNRNFPDPSNFIKRRAQKETEALMKLGDDNRFVLSADFHGGIELACYPWGHRKNNNYTVDNAWWEMISKEYAENAQNNSPNGYFTGQNNGIINGADWYVVSGERMNYTLFYQSCRLLTLEISGTKLLSASKLEAYWGYNKKAMLDFMQQTLYGINGTVVDSNTGEGIVAKVFVENHDKENSHVFSNPKYGDFYRPIFKGTYDVTFSCDGYTPKTVKGITVENGKATTLKVELWDGTTDILSHQKSVLKGIKVIQNNFSRNISFQVNFPNNKSMTSSIYSANGTLIKHLKLNKNSFKWDGTDVSGKYVATGCYIFKVKIGNTELNKNIMIVN